jgi:hypothetical protein
MKPRDPARIDAIVDLLREAWKKHPDWRLCQLISNCVYSSLDQEQRARVISGNEARGRSMSKTRTSDRRSRNSRRA